MKVPLLDLRAQYATIKDEVLAAIGDVLESQVCILGPKVVELEEKIAQLSDCRFGVGVSSGTDALLASLMALHIGQGDEVTPTLFLFFGTGGSISRAAEKQLFFNIDRRWLNIDPGLIKGEIT